MKKCRDCGQEKKLEDFSIQTNNTDGTGRHNQCRECMSAKRSPNKRKPRKRTYYPDEFGESYEDGFG